MYHLYKMSWYICSVTRSVSFYRDATYVLTLQKENIMATINQVEKNRFARSLHLEWERESEMISPLDLLHSYANGYSGGTTLDLIAKLEIEA